MTNSFIPKLRAEDIFELIVELVSVSLTKEEIIEMFAQKQGYGVLATVLGAEVNTNNAKTNAILDYATAVRDTLIALALMKNS